MRKTYNVEDILYAIDELLEDTKKNRLKIEKPLILKKELNNSRRKNIDIPKNTEDIILKAEKYLKKN
tara:strand:+ start:2636 stop:2836 length:201 start_codon:yes stop_codon:yes gene_type:complete